jgi:hypothetical protein
MRTHHTRRTAEIALGSMAALPFTPCAVPVRQPRSLRQDVAARQKAHHGRACCLSAGVWVGSTPGEPRVLLYRERLERSGSANSRQLQASAGRPASAKPRQCGVAYS